MLLILAVALLLELLYTLAYEENKRQFIKCNISHICLDLLYLFYAICVCLLWNVINSCNGMHGYPLISQSTPYVLVVFTV